MSVIVAIVVCLIVLAMGAPVLLVAALGSLIMGSLWWAIGFVIVHIIFMKK